MKLVEAIIKGKYDLANDMMAEQFRIILERKMCEAKKKVAAKIFEEDPFVKNLAPISQDGVDPNRTAKFAAMAASQPSTVKGPPPTNADKEKAAQFEEDVELKEARINIVKARIRGGKIQRRKRVSNVPGMTLRGGQLKRMSAAERRARKLGAKRAKLKTRGKQAQILRKRKVSLQKRQRLGL